MTRTLAPVALAVSGLDYHYPDGVTALSGVEITLAPGERLALLGPNGAGKSTLLLHLAGLLPERRRYLHSHDHPHPHRHHDPAAQIVIDGLHVSPKTLPEIRHRVGIVFSDPDDQLIGLTVQEEVEFGPRARRWPDEEVARLSAEALSRVGLSGFEQRSPHHLSAGEKRRVSIAGVLACRPGLLLMDEPSSGLDPRGRREIGELLGSLEATQVIATHDLDFAAAICSRALILDGGKIVARGDIKALLADQQLLRQHGLA